VRPFETLGTGARKELAAEGDALLRFSEPAAERFEVRFEKQ
jgi:hypothetical protein